MIVIFLGASGVGKTHSMLYSAKILTEEGQEVLVLDSTSSQGILSYIGEITPLESSLPSLVREDFTIINTSSFNPQDTQILKEFDISDYDYVFIECDECTIKSYQSLADRIILVQNYDTHCFNQNKTIIKELNEHTEKTVILINNVISGSVESSFFSSSLMAEARFRYEMIHKGQIEILFSEKDYVTSLENKIKGRISFQNHTTIFRERLEDFLDQLEDRG